MKITFQKLNVLRHIEKKYFKTQLSRCNHIECSFILSFFDKISNFILFWKVLKLLVEFLNSPTPI